MTLDTADLDVFFDADDFGVICWRHRAGFDPVQVIAIVGVHTEDYFDAAVRDKRREALFPAADVRHGDQFEITAGPRAGTYRVEGVEVKNDGAEMLARLTTP